MSDYGFDQDQVVVALPVTTFGGGGTPHQGDVKISDWMSTGLTDESWVRARRLWSLSPHALIGSCLGEVSDDVFAQVLVEVQRLFRP